MNRLVMAALCAAPLVLITAPTAQAADPPPATFSSLSTYAVGAAPRVVVVGDVNSDGKQDAVTADSSIQRVSVLLGKGDGTFDTSYSAGSVSGVRGVALGDMNKDGRVDIVASTGTASVSVLQNDGATTPAFTATSYTMFTGATGQRNVAVADFNADSWPDMAVAAITAGKVGVRLGDGSGGFSAFSEYTTGPGPTGLAAADFNADGKPDLVSFNRNGLAASSTATILLNGGSGTFTATNLGIGVGPDFGAAGDLTGDGKADIVAANTTSTAGLTVGLNDGSGTFTKGVNYALPTGTIAEGAALADVNLDGKLDAVVATNGTGFALYLGKGDGTFATGTTVTTSSGMPYGVTTGDLNADSKPDVLLTSANATPNNLVGVMLNTTVAGPGAPTDVSATPGDGKAQIAFTAPAGATGITNYEYSVNGGSTWITPDPASTTSPLTIAGLTNSTAYQVKIRAVNAAGSGTASAAVTVTPSAKPTAPRSPVFNDGVLSWSAPAWASAPTAYVVSYKRWEDRADSAVPWGVYAARAASVSAQFPADSVPLQVSLNATKNACGIANTSAGWMYCPLPRGWVAGGNGYALRVYAMNGSKAGPTTSVVQVIP